MPGRWWLDHVFRACRVLLAKRVTAALNQFHSRRQHNSIACSPAGFRGLASAVQLKLKRSASLTTLLRITLNWRPQGIPILGFPKKEDKETRSRRKPAIFLVPLPSVGRAGRNKLGRSGRATLKCEPTERLPLIPPPRPFVIAVGRTAALGPGLERGSAARPSGWATSSAGAAGP